MYYESHNILHSDRHIFASVWGDLFNHSTTTTRQHQLHITRATEMIYLHPQIRTEKTAFETANGQHEPPAFGQTARKKCRKIHTMATGRDLQWITTNRNCLRRDDLLMDAFGSANARTGSIWLTFHFERKLQWQLCNRWTFARISLSRSSFTSLWNIRGDFQMSSIVCSVPLQLQHTHGRSVTGDSHFIVRDIGED